MNKEQLNDNDLLGKWIKESGHESPSLKFSQSIVEAITQEQQRTIYQPVISQTGIGLIFTCILSSCIYALFFGQSGQGSGIWSLEKLRLPKVNFIDFTSLIPSFLNYSILTLSLVAFSVLGFLGILFWSRSINKA